jgi:hypothetical protein
MFDAVQQGMPTEKIEPWVISQFEQQTAPHFSYLWGRCSESEKITLLSTIMLCRRKPDKDETPFLERLVRIYPRAAMDAEKLIRRGILPQRNGDSTCFSLLSSSLESWIIRELAADPDEEASQVSVNEWLKSGKLSLDEPDKTLMTKVKKQYWPLFATILKEVSLGVAGNIAFEMLLRGVF